MDTVQGIIPVDPFLIHSSSSNWYILYLIAIDLRRRNPKFLTRVGKHCELGNLKVRIHDSAFTSIAYQCWRGTGVLLPAIDSALPTTTTEPRAEISPSPLPYSSSPSQQPSSSSPHPLPSIPCRSSSSAPPPSSSSLPLSEQASKASLAPGDDGSLPPETLDSFALYNGVQTVAEKIMELFDDRTLRTQAASIAQYLLKCERMRVSDVLRQLGKPGAKAVIQKLLNCSSDLLSSDPRVLGVDVSNYIVSEKIQKSLDVKSVQTKTATMMPKIKHTILHSHPTLVWIRFYSTYPDIANVRFLESNDYRVLPICENVYEFYINKTSPDRDVSVTNAILKTLEKNYDADIIFCSELQYFAYNKLLFISNYVKFTWCYLLDKQIFNPSTAKDFKTLCIYMIYSFLFLQSHNLAHMSVSTHNPLIAYTGERPRTAMNKFSTDEIYQAEGHRAMMTIGKSGDFGSRSNFIEIISEIEIDHSIMNEII